MKTITKTILLAVYLMSIICCMANEKNVTQYARLVETKTNIPDENFIKVALLLDTSNSMDGLIDQAKAQLWEIVNELSYAKCGIAKPNLQIALYEYGNDNLNNREGFIRQVLSFSDDLDKISKELFSLTTNGGNEYCGQVIQTSLNQLQWDGNENDLKMIFIAGNEPFSQGKISYKDAAEQAHKKDVSVNTIFCGEYNQGVASYWKEGADLTNGNYMAINHNQATTYIASPYDDDILKLNQKLNDTYLAYGSVGKQKMALQAEQDSNAKKYSEANAVSRTVSKSSHLYKNSTWDLVDAEDDEEFEFSDLKDEDLPEILKGKSTSEIKKYIDEMSIKREKVQNEIKSLNEKRRVFISKNKSEKSGRLDNALIMSIKTQAKQKNYEW